MAVKSDNKWLEIIAGLLAASVIVPTPPEEGTYTLKSVDGEVEWVEDV